MPRRYRPRPPVARRRPLRLTDDPPEWWEDDRPLLPALTVYEPDADSEPTGLYDAHGNELMARRDETRPIGFLAARDDA